MVKSSVYRPTVLFALCCVFQTASFAQQNPSRPYDPAIESYVNFLKLPRQSPINYILNLFETRDIVILCERVHVEMTQYDLVFNLVRDKRFIQTIGHVFTEMGTSSLKPEVESFLMADRLNEKEATERLLFIYRNFDNELVFFKTNSFTFLKEVYGLNKTLPPHLKIHVHPSDMPFQWQGMTKEKYLENKKNRGDRDKIMADQIIEKFNAIRGSPDPRKKALVIMNYRHAFPHLELKGGARVRRFLNVGGFLMEAYPGKAANVMLNSIRLLPGTTDNKAVITAIQEGKWDASFSVLGNPDIGFDFLNSPFGIDSFDFFPIPNEYKYQDIFSGFIFYKPLEAHRMSKGIPGLFDPQFVDEVTRRFQIISDNRPLQEIAQEIDKRKQVQEFDYSNKDLFVQSNHQEKIRQWLKNTKDLN